MPLLWALLGLFFGLLQTNIIFLEHYNVKNAHPVLCAGIRTH